MSGAIEFRVPRTILTEPDPEMLAWRAIERIWEAIDIPDDPEPLQAQLAPLTAGQRSLLSIHWCIREVSNGGFDQFFSNSAGGLIHEAREGFVRVGNELFASILDQVMALFPNERPALERRLRVFQLRRMRGTGAERFDRFEPYDNAFLSMLGLGEIQADMATYVLEHPEEFVLAKTPPAD